MSLLISRKTVTRIRRFIFVRLRGHQYVISRKYGARSDPICKIRAADWSCSFALLEMCAIEIHVTHDELPKPNPTHRCNSLSHTANKNQILLRGWCGTTPFPIMGAKSGTYKSSLRATFNRISAACISDVCGPIWDGESSITM